MKTRFLGAAVAAAFLFSGTAVYAQNQPSAEFEKSFALMRQNLRSSKKQILAANLTLTDAEATRFWPVYDAYAAEMTTQYDQFYAVIKDYAVNQATLTDDQAIAMIKRWADIQVAITGIRQKYVPLVAKVIAGRKAALFFQVDRRLYAVVDLQVASELPLVNPTKQ